MADQHEELTVVPLRNHQNVIINRADLISLANFARANGGKTSVAYKVAEHVLQHLNGKAPDGCSIPRS